MVMCARCHKRLAVVFITKMENGERVSEGICLKCAKEGGLPVDHMLGGIAGQMGMTPEQLESMEDSMTQMITPSDHDDNEDGGAPAIDLPRLFGEAMGELSPDRPQGPNPPASRRDNGKSNRRPGDNRQQRPTEPKLKYLTTYCRNLTAAAREGKLDRIVGRERELARTVQILCRRQKSNPCLIGEPGVGKTAIAEALAIRIAAGNVPYKLKNKELYLVDMTALVAGTQFRGQFEQRILGLLGEVKSEGNVILFIDEVHNIVGSGEAEGAVNAANMLKPALSRGEVQIIGATTLTEYRKYIEKDTALERRFQPVTVEEPSVAEAVEMLGGIKHYYESFHSISIPQGVLYKAVVMSERYITDRYLPDKAIDLLDEAAAHLSLSSASLNESYELRDKLLNLKVRRETIENAETAAGDEKAEERRYQELASIKADELKFSARLNELEPDCKAITLTPAHLAEVIEVWTGIPATTITENEFEQVDRLSDRLKQHIIGQDAAVDAVARAVKRNRAGVSAKRKPVSFIFAGPTGVGKTELVKRLAADLFHSPETLIRLDMSEFMEKASVSRLIGSPPGYVGYDDAGQLTEKVRRKPYSVVLFDEIEKAHPDVLNVMLQILDDGRLTDAHGKTVNFENTIIVMTTNAGSDRSTATIGFSDADNMNEDATMKALSSFLRPEFINRVDEIITFRSLSREDFVAIARILLNELKDALAEQGVNFTYTEESADFVARESYSARFGARNMRRYIRRHVEDQLAEAIIADYQRAITQAKLILDEDKLTVVCM
ncbi:MAG: ATP-dependent Clp protease ATP-binding subunit [Ruminococcaceae bacterium]|nr:ATP-dependent Clp protease ATP-binding subunit [Oscillospiraceae bacterium]